MKTRTLGRHGPSVSALGLGCMGMTGVYGQRDDPESLATLDRALELGINFWDTADIYGPHTNEELLGRALKGRREQVFLATKFGFLPGATFGNRDRSPALDASPGYIRMAVDASLQRLGTDHIDLYYQHRIDPKVPIEDSVGALAELVKAGKIRYIGLSEAGPENLRRAQAVHPITALQSEYSLWTRDLENSGVLATVRELDIGLVPFSPLGRGFLTGAITDISTLPDNDYRRSSPRFQEQALQANLRLAETVKSLAVAKGATPAQVALAWLLAQDRHIVPIPGTKRRRYLEDNAGAVDLTLSGDELATLDQTFARDNITGDRYTAGDMALVDH